MPGSIRYGNLVLCKSDQYNLSSGKVKLLDLEEIITNTQNCTIVLILPYETCNIIFPVMS